jgi:hypothetical protein
MTKPKTLRVALTEGGNWVDFPCTHLNGPEGIRVHTIVFDNGWEWDAYNGWRPDDMLTPHRRQSGTSGTINTTTRFPPESGTSTVTVKTADYEPYWERVNGDIERLPVVGGWLYRRHGFGGVSEMVFVPQPPLMPSYAPNPYPPPSPYWNPPVTVW